MAVKDFEEMLHSLKWWHKALIVLFALPVIFLLFLLDALVHAGRTLKPQGSQQKPGNSKGGDH